MPDPAIKWVRLDLTQLCVRLAGRGIAPGVVEKLVADVDSAPVSAKLKPLLALVKKLALTPTEVSQSDADAVFAAGWDEQAYHSAVAVTARMTFMCKIIHGHGFIPMSPERAKAGYVALYPQLAKR